MIATSYTALPLERIRYSLGGRKTGENNEKMARPRDPHGLCAGDGIDRAGPTSRAGSRSAQMRRTAGEGFEPRPADRSVRRAKRRLHGGRRRGRREDDGERGVSQRPETSARNHLEG